MAIFKKIENKIRSVIIPKLIKLSVILRWPALTAQILAASAQRLNDSGGYAVLCMRRSVFMDDVWAMIRYSGRIRYLALERRYLRVILLNFLSEQDRRKLTEGNYHLLPELGQKAKQEYYWYLKKVLPILRKKLKFQAIFSGNFGYLEQQELMRLANEEHIPFIVLHKEGMAVQSLYKEYAQMYAHHRFLGVKILFYNEQIKQALFDAGVDGVTEEKAAVVGIPRLDVYFQKGFREGSVKHIAFFSFFPRDKFRYLTNNEELLKKIEKRSAEFHRMVMKFAEAHADFQIVIKTKSSAHYMEYIRGLRDSGFPEVLPNLIVTNAASPTKLIENSKAVMGFNSTTLIEALIANRLVVTPYFGDLVTHQAWDYFRDYPEFVKYARTFEELEKYLLQPEQNLPRNAERKVRFLYELIYTPNGRASSRAEDALISTVKAYEKI